MESEYFPSRRVMKILNNFTLLTKLTLPLCLIFLVSAAVVFFARSNLLSLADDTQEIVDVRAARAIEILQVAVSLDEATLRQKSITSETNLADIQKLKEGYDALKQKALVGAENLIAMSDTPERKSKHEITRRLLGDYFLLADRANSLSLSGQNAEAIRISNNEARDARRKVVEAVNQRIDATRKNLDEAKNRAVEIANSATQKLTALAAIGLAVSIGVLWAIVALGVTRPLSVMTRAMSHLASGQLDVRVDGTSRKDEVGLLARSLQVFKDNAIEAQRLAAAEAAEDAAKMRRAQILDELTKTFEHKVSALSHGLAGAASEMEVTAHSMTGIAQQSTQQTVIVEGAAERTSVNVQTVAAASEEMSASVQDIVYQVNQSAQIAQQAVDKAIRTNETVQRLNATAERITSAASIIAGIAAQTNLLALNATIEAARAGEVGRGFAVVANEVKELAGQSARATGEIGERISEIRAATREAVSDIQEIGRVITEMSTYAGSVAAAMEEQGAATKEIARNVQQAAHSTEQVKTNISSVREGAVQTSTAASQVLNAAQKLTQHSERLSHEVGAFLAGVKAA
ncbi:methyl-accepting chemotaxis protein [Methylobacterium sp. E-005]|uniref:methyl-accepting chemotaxis protein n=1 Tax=Methylobacterium sp. E-005 TaxID=2836549 RepID=UPI001FBB71A0|nr:HAMP domain-containing methyl-accepting chemotaxis protein [Methylobacterium sp. E-005]MCJ2088348.1 methyl-accepting chemotaxis protein [Methylobacterium sp. E-005]